MLSLKKVSVQSFEDNIAYIHKSCTGYRAFDVKTITRIEIHGGIQPVYASLHITEDINIVKPDELGLNSEAYEKLGLPEGANVSIAQSPQPPSVESVKRKMEGSILSAGEYTAVINDISSNRYSMMEVASFLVACGSFMTAQEILSLTEAIAGENERVFWDNEEMVVDHHCIGGIPGNKVDLIIAPIVAAYGMAIPKTAARSITSCSGVADVMGVLANVDFNETKLKQLVTENRGAIVCKDSLSIAPASKILSTVERSVGVINQQHVAASILALKLATGITHLVLDVPVGPKARIKSMPEAMRLRKLIEYVGDMLSIEVDVVVTDGSEPIGSGVGAVLEARDVMRVLRCKDNAPQDLREKSLFLAGRLLEFDPNLRGGQGYHIAKDILDSGKALEMMNKIIYSQGREAPPVLGQLTRDVVANTTGVVEAIDNNRIMRIGVLAGASQDRGAGLDLIKKVGDSVEQGETLFRIHSTNPTDFAFANGVVEGYSGYEISPRSHY